MRSIDGVIRRSWRHLGHNLDDAIEHSLPNLSTMGAIGVIGFPLFFAVWTWLFPQEYDSPSLRLVGFVISLGFLFHAFWRNCWPQSFRLFWLIGSSYGLSFFFVFMLLMNDASLIWSMSTLVGLMLMVLLVSDWLLMTLMYVSGVGLAVAVAQQTLPNGVSFEPLYQQLPIFLFAMVTGSVFNHRSAIVRAAKQKAVAAMGASVAHELRTPLLTIKSEADEVIGSLAETPTEIEQSVLRHAQVILREQSHAETIIEMLLVGLDSLEVSALPTERKALFDIIDRALTQYPYTDEQNKTRLVLDIGVNEEIQVSELLIMHVLFNLLKNSFRAIENQPDGKITITSDVDSCSGRPVIRVHDNGCGIAPAVLPRVFDDFFTTSALGRGSGIGLAFCRRVMKQHGGEIRCQSEFGLWTEFTLLFPPVSASAKDERSPSLEAPRELLREGGRALIVDDEEINRRRLAALIGSSLDCEFAGSVSEAQVQLQDKRYDVVFCDQHMPGGQGSDFLSELAEEPDLVRVLVTGDWRCRAAAMTGVDLVLLKPLEQASVDRLFVTEEPPSAKVHCELTRPAQSLLHLAHDICSPLAWLEHCCDRMRRTFPALHGLNAHLPHEQRLQDEELNALQSLPRQFERVVSLSREKIRRLRSDEDTDVPTFPAEMERLWRNSERLCRLTLQPTLPRLVAQLEQHSDVTGPDSTFEAVAEWRKLSGECDQLHVQALTILQRYQRHDSAALQEVVGAE